MEGDVEYMNDQEIDTRLRNFAIAAGVTVQPGMTRSELDAAINASTTIPSGLRDRATDEDIVVTDGMTVGQVREALHRKRVEAREQLCKKRGYRAPAVSLHGKATTT
jgi:hypothetical protein